MFSKTEDTYAFPVRVLPGFMGSVDAESLAGKQLSIVSGKVYDAMWLTSECVARVPRESPDVHVHAVHGTDPIPLSVADPSQSPWTDSQIRVFLLEWEGVEQEVGHPGKKIHKKTRVLCQRLYQRGLRKTWQSCFNLLLTLQNLHRSLCDERPRAEPLFSPYAEALYRILGHRPQESYFPG